MTHTMKHISTKHISIRACALLLPVVAALGPAPQASALPKKAHVPASHPKRVHPAKAPIAQTHETIGSGTIADPARGPAPSFGIGGPGMVLVKNWHFGANGTVKNYADMSANFYYHDQFGTINNGGKYGSSMVSPDFANSIHGQPIEGINSAPVRRFTADSLLTFLTPLDKAVKVQVWNHNTGNGSFIAKWRLPTGGPGLGRDIVWETRVRYKTPPYYWFALWTAGNKWKWDGQAQGAEQDLVESFGYDNGGGNTNYDGRFWHSNSVASPSKDTVDYSGWGTAMEKLGIKSYDAAQYHVWTWLYKKDGTFAMYVDGTKVQGGSNYYWTYGNKAGDEPIDMDFLFDAGWGHNQIGSVNKELPASAFDGKFYEWNYSRVYLSGGGPHTITTVTSAHNPSATFIKADRATQGNWKGVYGTDGSIVAGGETRLPPYGSVTRTGWAATWAGSTPDARAPQKAGSSTDRVAGQWGTNDPSYDIDCTLTGDAVHRVSLYGLDWDLNGRSEDIQVLDAATGAVLDTQDLNDYNNGVYLVWNVRGHVIFRVKVTSHWTNPALSGIFFDPAAGAAPRKPQVAKLPQK